jgi:UDP-N-acetylmuramoyl-tripeptide--D-alanyl-D-alanine ligase
MNGSIEQQVLNGILILFGLTALSWLAGTLLYGLKLIYWWQVKEYRFDRMQAHRGTATGDALFGGFGRRVRRWYLLVVVALAQVVWAGYALVGDAWVNLVYPYYLLIVSALSLALLGRQVYEATQSLGETVRSGLTRPKLTAKAGALLALFALLLLYGILPAVVLIGYALGVGWLPAVAAPLQYLYVPGLWLVVLLLIDVTTAYLVALTLITLALPPLLQGAVYLLNHATRYGYARRIAAATQKAASRTDLKTVGITGSYGKTSTKEFLATLLSARYTVEKTPANNNTAIGLANAVLAGLAPETEVFVGEYGAYRDGEIQAMTEILRPRIAIVTAINEQHVELFGSIERTMDAKYELIAALPADGVAVFNADNPHCREMAKRYDGTKRFYSAKGKMQVGGVKASVLAMNIRPTAAAVGFDLVDSRDGLSDERKTTVELPLLGAHHVDNFLAAACAALELGMTLPEIAAAASAIRPIPGTMRPLRGKDDIRIVDDGYSVNPDGFMAALNYLETLPGRKVVITKGMQELGDTAVEAHRRVGEKAGAVADIVILMDRSYEDAWREGIGRRPDHAKTVLFTETAAVVEYLRTALHPGDTVLLEGRLPAGVLDYLTAGVADCEDCA